MEKTYYLYGAAVQGIQGFIFQTNELKDIVGASELVEEICTDFFNEFACGKDSVLRAAGNIKHIFERKEDCEKAVCYFPAKVMVNAPGITISQAVVEFDGTDFEKAVNELEKRLRIQRNRPAPSVITGYMGMSRSRKTGLPAIGSENGEYVDAATQKKKDLVAEAHYSLCQKSFGIKNLDRRIAYDINDIAKDNSWIAIVHADGNGLGNIVRSIGKQSDVLKDFSKKLDEATCFSAQKAFSEIRSHCMEGPVPLRPIVLGGDDMTVIIRGCLAMDYTRAYLAAFEEKTRELFQEMSGSYPCLDSEQRSILERGLTACAGIAYIKSSYPFYYGYDLAESLCSAAKKDAKSFDAELAPSCVMFHKVQDSFVLSFEEIKKRELTTKDGHSFVAGPYYLDNRKVSENRWTIDRLTANMKMLDGKEGNAVKTGLRQWMTVLHDNGEEAARQKKNRMLSQVEDDGLECLIENVISDKEKRHAVYDVLSLYSIFQETK